MLSEVYQHLAISAEFQLILDDALKEYSKQVMKNYNSGSYLMAGIVCVANAYNEVHLCFTKHTVISIRVPNFPYTLEVQDLANFYPGLRRIRKFEGCLHHIMTTALKDPELSSYKNTVNSSQSPELFQVLELHKPEHIKNGIGFILNYCVIVNLFDTCRLNIEENLNALGKRQIQHIFKNKMLDLNIELANFEEYRFNVVLKMKTGTALEIDIEILVVAKRDNEAEKLEKWKKNLKDYFYYAVKGYCKGNPEIFFGFVRLFLVPIGLFGTLLEFLDEELSQRLKIEFC